MELFQLNFWIYFQMKLITHLGMDLNILVMKASWKLRMILITYHQGSSMSVFSETRQLNQGQMANFPAFLAWKTFDL